MPLSNALRKISLNSIRGTRVKGVSLDRNQTVLAGSIVLLQTMRSLKVSEITICTSALREG
ncbi:MAG: hypothetical protein ACPGSC_06280, partial [Granulosicoccaceae bacterium]